MVVLARKDTSLQMEMIGIFATAEEATSKGISALGIDPIQLLIQTITFLLLLWAIKKYALGSVVQKIEKRHKDINRGLHLTAEMDKEKAELDKKVEEALGMARREADIIIAEAHTESGDIIKASEESALRKVDGILRDAEGRIEREISDARRGLKKEMTSLVVEATEAIIEQKLDQKSDRELIEKYLSKVINND